MVASARHSARLTEYFAQFETDVVSTALLRPEGADGQDDAGRVYLATNGNPACMSADGSAFKGYAILHDRRQITFGPPPDSLRDRPVEGCYLNVTIRQEADGPVVGISNDLFGQLLILYTEMDGIFACSDSLLALTDLRRTFGYANLPDADLFLAKSSYMAFSDQLIDSRTSIVGIRYALPGSRIEVLQRGKQVKALISHPGAMHLFPTTGTSHAEAIQIAAANMAGMLGGIDAMPGHTLRLDLTGGQDSRTVLAAALAAGIDDNNVVLQCSTKAADDHAIAEKIASVVTLPFNPPRSGGRTRVAQMALWFAASAGVYDPLYSLFVRSTNMDFLTAGGHGAEVYKGNYNWRSIDKLVRNSTDLPDSVRQPLRSGACSGLEAFGIDPQAPDASEWHYLAFRSAIHSGRFTNSSLFGLRPLLQQSIVGHAHDVFLSRRRAAGPNRHSVISDLLIHLNPALAGMPFLDERKNLTSDEIVERSCVLGRIGAVSPYTVIGAPDAASTGPLAYLLKLAETRGFGGDFAFGKIADLVAQAYDKAPASLHPHIDRMRTNTAAGFVDPMAGNSEAARAAGKILALHLAD